LVYDVPCINKIIMFYKTNDCILYCDLFFNTMKRRDYKYSYMSYYMPHQTSRHIPEIKYFCCSKFICRG
jgi:hypothetical protein